MFNTFQFCHLSINYISNHEENISFIFIQRGCTHLCCPLCIQAIYGKNSELNCQNKFILIMSDNFDRKVLYVMN